MEVESLGARIKRLRVEQSLSQRQLCTGLDRFSYAYLSRVEADARQPSVRALRLIAERLGVTAYYLEKGTEAESTHQAALTDASAELETVIGLISEAEERLARLRHRTRR